MRVESNCLVLREGEVFRNWEVQSSSLEGQFLSSAIFRKSKRVSVSIVVFMAVFVLSFKCLV